LFQFVGFKDIFFSMGGVPHNLIGTIARLHIMLVWLKEPPRNGQPGARKRWSRAGEHDVVGGAPVQLFIHHHFLVSDLGLGDLIRVVFPWLRF
jgi:hypothetical protein